MIKLGMIGSEAGCSRFRGNRKGLMIDESFAMVNFQCIRRQRTWRLDQAVSCMYSKARSTGGKIDVSQLAWSAYERNPGIFSKYDRDGL